MFSNPLVHIVDLLSAHVTFLYYFIFFTDFCRTVLTLLYQINWLIDWLNSRWLGQRPWSYDLTALYKYIIIITIIIIDCIVLCSTGWFSPYRGKSDTEGGREGSSYGNDVFSER